LNTPSYPVLSGETNILQYRHRFRGRVSVYVLSDLSLFMLFPLFLLLFARVIPGSYGSFIEFFVAVVKST